MSRAKFSDFLNIGKLDFFTAGFFKLRFLAYATFLGFLTQNIEITLALFIVFMWAQLEFLYFSIDLDDKFSSDWEDKLRYKIKRKGNGKKK